MSDALMLWHFEVQSRRGTLFTRAKSQEHFTTPISLIAVHRAKTYDTAFC